MTSMGIDPDVHGCAVAMLDSTNTLRVFVIRETRGKSRDAAISMITDNPAFSVVRHAYKPDVLTVEGQDARYTGTTCARPQDIVALALVTGACLASIPADVKYCPLPREWKATTRKDIKQRRIFKGLGIEFTMKGGRVPYEDAPENKKKNYYPVPLHPEKYTIGKVNDGDWKDLADAVGLAVWGLEKFKGQK